MNIVPKIFICVRPDTPIIPVCVSTMHDMVLKGVDIQVLQCSHSFLDIHNMVYPVALMMSSPEKPAPHYAKMEAYKAASGYWRVKVDGVVHPKLVGLDTEASAVSRALELFPNGQISRPGGLTNNSMKPLEECIKCNPDFLEQAKELVQEAVAAGEDEDEYAFIFINDNHGLTIPRPYCIVVASEITLFGNPSMVVSPTYTLGFLLKMVTP